MCHDDAKPARLDDPIAFATDLNSGFGAAGEMRLLEPAGAYGRNRAARAVARIEDLDEDSPLGRLDQAAYEWAADAYALGVRFGIAAEQLRRALLAAAESLGKDGEEGGASVSDPTERPPAAYDGYQQTLSGRNPFAYALYQGLYDLAEEGGNDRWHYECPAPWAAYEAASARVKALAGIDGGDAPLARAFAELDAAVLAYAGAMRFPEIDLGMAFADYRRALLGIFDERLCDPCRGTGWQGALVCQVCQGEGLVPMRFGPKAGG